MLSVYRDSSQSSLGSLWVLRVSVLESIASAPAKCDNAIRGKEGHSRHAGGHLLQQDERVDGAAGWWLLVYLFKEASIFDKRSLSECLGWSSKTYDRKTSGI
jgi:hypothetical protein